MFSLSFIAPFALLPFVAAQSSDFQLGIAGIEAHFKQSLLVPELLAAFDPTALIDVAYSGNSIQPGQPFTKDQVGSTPTVTINSNGASLSGNYTLALVDPGPVGADTSAGVTRHWLVNGLTISGTSFNNATSFAVTEYAGPAPPAGDGPHRYAFLVFEQPSSFAPPTGFDQANIGVSKFDLNAYVKDSGLGALVAGTYMTVEEGQATASLQSTSAVRCSQTFWQQ
ncbi:PEBP-like protein [Pluteus cervinus]|uniref:PEBP-like protein n=1 Tax=Pluteus cervinus TaxID=181527 RepID=A0ACD3B3D0_9AGAR|nr:PEBP-like protein [Pluteus cervinus]